jgi:hypothetical protein
LGGMAKNTPDPAIAKAVQMFYVCRLLKISTGLAVENIRYF